jgi:predicted HicB family RNase H-like nuclease
MKKPAKKTQTINLRVSPEFKKKLEREAAKDNRSITNYVEVTLTRFWETRADPNKVPSE